MAAGRFPRFIIFSLSLFLLFGVNALAQKRCNTVEAERERRARYPFLPDRREFEEWIMEKREERRNQLVPFDTHEPGDPDLIAVVVHVIHNGEPYGVGLNIPDEQILSQIEVLNEDFQRKNADTLDTQAEFLAAAGKLNLEFVLARQSPTGEPTTGIVREQGPKSAYNISIQDRELLSSVSQWDPHTYLNIWVTDLQNSYIGLAQFPDYDDPGLNDKLHRDNESTDGLVIDYTAFGSEDKAPGINVQSNYNLGRTTTHEIGHFFGLLHVWGDLTGPSGCGVDDYVGDTPNSSNEYNGFCNPASHESCGSNDMFENFLYYTNDACMNIFTKGQVDRMQLIIDNAPRRTSLLNSLGSKYPDDEFVDLALNEIVSPGKVMCDGVVTYSIEVKNNGTLPVSNFDIVYELNQQAQTVSYIGDTIFTGQEVVISIGEDVLDNGSYSLKVSFSGVTGDNQSGNDQQELHFAVDDKADFIPIRELFEASDLTMTDWLSINEDDLIGWELENAPRSSDDNTAAFMDFYNYEAEQQRDWLISPALDFSDAVEASMQFKVAHAEIDNYDDQLRIIASKDCGTNFEDVLAIYNSADLAATSSEDFWVPENQSEWRDFTIDLTDYVGEEQVRIAFLAINGYGNSLYLDEIEFYPTAEDKLVKTGLNSFTVYPNPVSDGRFQLVFKTEERQDIEVVIYDHMGRLITRDQYPNTLNQTYYYNVTGLRSGMYHIHSVGQSFNLSRKLLINR